MARRRQDFHIKRLPLGGQVGKLISTERDLRHGQLRAAQAVLMAMCLLMGTQGGCRTVGKAKLVQELQSENARLLSEYRAEKQRRQEIENRLALMEQRLAESEKLLAKHYSGTGQLGAQSPVMSAQLPSSQSNSSASRANDSLQWQRRPDAR
ncbi:MAG: hypothetical protein KatS3mg111_2819 [Pirellulaceae bacterium]|nr:MAG: hypothetical protein KatS3mg111_2819 [Pirellulaceae bacterium]